MTAFIDITAKAINEFFGISEDSLLYSCLPAESVVGKMTARCAELAGAEVLVARHACAAPQDRCPYIDASLTRRISLLVVEPAQVGYLVNNPDRAELADTMLIADGHLLDNRLECWLADKGASAYKAFGAAEAGGVVALSRVSRERAPLEAVGEITFTTDGRGCLVLSHPGTASTIATSNVVELVDERHFHWRGFCENVITTCGMQVCPEEVEREIAKLLPRARFRVAGVPSAEWGQELLLILEYSGIPAGARKEGPLRPEIVERLMRVLPRHAVPRRYIALNSLPPREDARAMFG